MELSYLQPEAEVFHWVVVLFKFLAWKAFGLKLCVNFYYGPSSFPIIKMKHIAQCKYTKIYDRKKGEASHPFQLPPPTPLPWIFDQPLPGCCYVYRLNYGEIWLLQIIYCAISFLRAITIFRLLHCKSISEAIDHSGEILKVFFRWTMILSRPRVTYVASHTHMQLHSSALQASDQMLFWSKTAKLTY